MWSVIFYTIQFYHRRVRSYTDTARVIQGIIRRVRVVDQGPTGNGVNVPFRDRENTDER